MTKKKETPEAADAEDPSTMSSAVAEEQGAPQDGEAAPEGGPGPFPIKRQHQGNQAEPCQET